MGLIALQRTGRRLTTQDTKDDTCLTDLKNIRSSAAVETVHQNILTDRSIVCRKMTGLALGLRLFGRAVG